MSELMLKVYCRTKVAWHTFKNQERGAINFVEIAIILGIVMVLAMVFRDTIYKLVDNLLKGIGGFDVNENKPTAPTFGN